MRTLLLAYLFALSCFCWAQSDAVAQGKIRTDLVVMILSHDGDDRRNSIRETWLKDEVNRTRWAFIVGNIDYSPHREKVLDEQKKYNDIIVMNDVNDGYQHLSDKVLRGLQEVYKRYECDFVLKIDTDTFVILPRAHEYLDTVTPDRAYIGFVAKTTNEKELYGFMSGAYYMLGGGYVLSYDLVEYFALNQHMMRRSFSEDVTVGVQLHGLWVNVIGRPHHVFKSGASEPCSCYDTILLNHKCSKSEMYYMYYSFQQTAKICEWKTNTTYGEYLAKTYSIPTDGEVEIKWMRDKDGKEVFLG